MSLATRSLSRFIKTCAIFQLIWLETFSKYQRYYHYIKMERSWNVHHESFRLVWFWQKCSNHWEKVLKTIIYFQVAGLLKGRGHHPFSRQCVLIKQRKVLDHWPISSYVKCDILSIPNCSKKCFWKLHFTSFISQLLLFVH